MTFFPSFVSLRIATSSNSSDQYKKQSPVVPGLPFHPKMKTRTQQYSQHDWQHRFAILTMSVLAGVLWNINGSGANGQPAIVGDSRAIWWPQNHLAYPKDSKEESNINQLLSSEANEKSDLGRHIGLQRIAWALEHGSREEPAREVPKNHFDEFGTRGLTASGSKIWNGKRFLGVNAFLPKRSLEEAISEYGRVIKRSGIGAPQLGSPSTLLITVPKTKYSEIKMPGDFRIMKRSY